MLGRTLSLLHVVITNVNNTINTDRQLCIYWFVFLFSLSELGLHSLLLCLSFTKTELYSSILLLLLLLCCRPLIRCHFLQSIKFIIRLEFKLRKLFRTEVLFFVFYILFLIKTLEANKNEKYNFTFCALTVHISILITILPTAHIQKKKYEINSFVRCVKLRICSIDI